MYDSSEPDGNKVVLTLLFKYHFCILRSRKKVLILCDSFPSASFLPSSFPPLP